MYTDLEKDYTKTRYSQILQETKLIAENKISLNPSFEDLEMWISIIKQIEDIDFNSKNGTKRQYPEI